MSRLAIIICKRGMCMYKELVMLYTGTYVATLLMTYMYVHVYTCIYMCKLLPL